jgi:hypothetical protein
VAEANQKYDDEIDLIELFLTLWPGKWIIIGFPAVSLAIAGIQLAMIEPKYESRIEIKQNINLLFLGSTNLRPAPAINDFIDKFYPQEVIIDWAKESNNKLLTSMLGFSAFYNIKNKQTELFVSSGDPKIIDLHFQYTDFINRFLTQNYQASSKEALLFLKEQAEDTGSYSDQIVILLLNTNSFLKNAIVGELVLDFRTPTKLDNFFSRTKSVLILSVVLGGFVGGASVLLINILRKRKFDATKLSSNDRCYEYKMLL